MIGAEEGWMEEGGAGKNEETGENGGWEISMLSASMEGQGEKWEFAVKNDDVDDRAEEEK